MCKVHSLPLLQGDVTIRYGLIRHSDAYLKARAKLFPNANSFAVGGCYVSETFPKTATVSYCPECRLAEQAWNEQDKG